MFLWEFKKPILIFVLEGENGVPNFELSKFS